MSKIAKSAEGTPADRRGSDRRIKNDRRHENGTMVLERRKGVRREKVNRRRQIDPTTCEREYSDVELEFMHALDAYKRKNGRMFPTCSEILEVIRDLGYVKTAAAATAPHDSTCSALGQDSPTSEDAND